MGEYGRFERILTHAGVRVQTSQVQCDARCKRIDGGSLGFRCDLFCREVNTSFYGNGNYHASLFSLLGSTLY